MPKKELYNLTPTVNKELDQLKYVFSSINKRQMVEINVFPDSSNKNFIPFSTTFLWRADTTIFVNLIENKTLDPDKTAIKERIEQLKILEMEIEQLKMEIETLSNKKKLFRLTRNINMLKDSIIFYSQSDYKKNLNELYSHLKKINKIASQNSSYLHSLPYPPPRPSSIHVLSEKEIESCKTFDDVNKLIDENLKGSGYYDKSYYSVPGGFAVVTRLEKIDVEGNPEKGQERWSEMPSLDGVKTMIDYLINLLTPNNGRYRMLIIWVSNQPIFHTKRDFNIKDLTILPYHGANFLPYQFSKQELPERTTVSILLYELKKREIDDKFLFVEKSVTSCYKQMFNTGLFLK